LLRRLVAGRSPLRPTFDPRAVPVRLLVDEEAVTEFSLMGYKYSKFNTHTSNTSLSNVIKPTTAQNFRPDIILLFYIYKTSR
jgi:hypothetical protein